MTRKGRRAYMRRWRKAHPTYSRDWMRRWRANVFNRKKERARPWYRFTGEHFATILGVRTELKKLAINRSRLHS